MLINNKLNENRNIKSAICIIFTILMVLFPVFQVYASPIPFITLPEFILAILILFYIVFFKFPKNILDSFFPFLVYTLLLIIYYSIVYFIYKESLYYDSAGTFGRLVFIYLILYLFANELFSKKIAIWILKLSSLIFCIYAFAQIIFAKFDIYLYNCIPFLPSMEGIGGTTYDSIVALAKAGYSFRPYSLFREPAHYATFVAIALFISLFSKKRIFDWILIAVFTISIVFSKSSTGIFSIAFVFCLYFVFLLLIKKIKRLYILIGFTLFCAVCSLVLIFTPIGKYFLDKTFNGDFSINSILRINRISNVLSVFEYDGILKVLIGVGSENTSNYLPGFAATFNSLGLIGYCLLLYAFMFFMSKKNLPVTFFVIFFFFLNIGTEIVLGCFSFVFVCLMNSGLKEQGFEISNYGEC